MNQEALAFNKDMNTIIKVINTFQHKLLCDNIIETRIICIWLDILVNPI